MSRNVKRFGQVLESFTYLVPGHFEKDSLLHLKFMKISNCMKYCVRQQPLFWCLHVFATHSESNHWPKTPSFFLVPCVNGASELT